MQVERERIIKWMADVKKKLLITVDMRYTVFRIF